MILWQDAGLGPTLGLDISCLYLKNRCPTPS
jgi:hypothetical protein